MPPDMARKISLKPTNEQKVVLDQMFGCARATYNWALYCIKNDKEDKYKEMKCNHFKLRNEFVPKLKIPDDKKYLYTTCPKMIRDYAIKELTIAYSTNFTIRRENPNHKFDIQFRKKKDEQTITIEKDCVRSYEANASISPYPTFLQNKIKLSLKRNKLPNNIDYAVKITRTRLGKYILSIPCLRSEIDESASENQASKAVPSDRYDWCAIDPGVRSLYTVYSPAPGIAYKIGDKDISRIYRLLIHVDKLCNSKSKTKVLAKHRLIRRIKNLVKEVHNKTTLFLLQNFRNIILPSFDVSQMVKKNARKIKKNTVRKMLTWSHYKLKQSIIENSPRFGCNVYIRSEEYTTKTCGNCLELRNIGGAKTYRCIHCKAVLDRDLNGARNVFMKNTISVE